MVDELEVAGVTLARMVVKDQEERAIALRDLNAMMRWFNNSERPTSTVYPNNSGVTEH